MSRPSLPQGYLGAQGKWKEWGMSTISHSSPEITTNSSSLNIQIRVKKPMRVTTKLTACDTEEVYQDLVFTQTQGEEISLLVSLPSAGFFKLQIFAILATDDAKSLPNVFNYLIHSTAVCQGPVLPYPKQFAQWKDGCYLSKPLHLSDLDTAVFEVTVPGAKAVALTVDKEWFQLKQGSEGVWRGEIKGMNRFKGKVQKAVLNANYGGAEKTKYTSLLEYSL